jgi:hypothetical protein
LTHSILRGEKNNNNVTGTDISKLVLVACLGTFRFNQLGFLLNLYRIKGKKEIQDTKETEVNFG